MVRTFATCESDSWYPACHIDVGNIHAVLLSLLLSLVTQVNCGVNPSFSSRPWSSKILVARQNLGSAAIPDGKACSVLVLRTLRIRAHCDAWTV